MYIYVSLQVSTRQYEIPMSKEDSPISKTSDGKSYFGLTRNVSVSALEQLEMQSVKRRPTHESLIEDFSKESKIDLV